MRVVLVFPAVAPPFPSEPAGHPARPAAGPIRYNRPGPGRGPLGGWALNHLIPPHGGSLVRLLAAEDQVATLRERSRDWLSCDLTPRQLCDLEQLLNGGFSPLDGYMGRADSESVCARMRRSDGTLWPIPITLDVDAELGQRLRPGDWLALRDPEGVLLAGVNVEEVWRPDRAAELTAVFGGVDPARSAIDAYLDEGRPFAVAGPVVGVQPPVHYDYRELRLGPRELRRLFARLGWRRVLAYQTHQTMHRAQQVLTERTARELDANLLLHPVVGSVRAGDPDHFTRVRCYEALLGHYPPDMVRLNLLELAPRGGGPREALLDAIVHRNAGCTHFMIEHDVGGSVLETAGAPAWDPAAALALVEEHHQELGIAMVPFQELGFLERGRELVAVGKVPSGERVLRITGSEVRERLALGAELPEWFTLPEVERELRRRHPPRNSQGFTVFFTGLSGAGKSTIAHALRVKLMELGGRGVSLLDGDLVRRNLSSELGFSRAHRDLNIHRIGFVAAEITRAGGIALCAPIAPYDAVRRQVRSLIEPWGGFILVHVATPIEVCEARDRKGMYAKARAGVVREFTGISDPYEAPTDAEVIVDTSRVTPEEATDEVLRYLDRQGYIPAGSPAGGGGEAARLRAPGNPGFP